jgi:hypothetical protein
VGKRAVSDTEVLDPGGVTTLSRLMDAHGLHLLAAVVKRDPDALTVVLNILIITSDVGVMSVLSSSSARGHSPFNPNEAALTDIAFLRCNIMV